MLPNPVIMRIRSPQTPVSIKIIFDLFYEFIIIYDK
jgi:hypothetical protein